MKKKVLLSSVLSIVLCLSLICGATFALFTDTDQVDIAVTSGKVDIEVTVENITTKSYEQDDWDGDTYFTNGGAVLFDDESNQLTIDKITPGDAVKFELVITNDSNIDILYRAKLGLTDGLELFQGMDMYFDGEKTAHDGITRVTTWEEIPAAEAEAFEKRVEVIIELPYLTAEQDPTNEQSKLMGKSTTMYYTVEAVQANADPKDIEAIEAGTTYLYTPIDLQIFAQNVKNGNNYAGQTVKLMNDIDLAGINWTPISGFAGTFDGAKSTASTTLPECYTISNLTVSGTSGVGMFTSPATSAVFQNIKFENATVSGNHYVAVLLAHGLCVDISNVHVANSTVTAIPELLNGVYDNGDKAGAVFGYLCADGGAASVTNCSATNVSVTAFRDLGGVGGYLGTASGAVATAGGLTAAECSLTFVSAAPYAEGKVNSNAKTIVGRTDVEIEGNTEVTPDVSTSTSIVGTDEAAKEALTGTAKHIVLDLTADVTYQVSSWNTFAMGGESTESITINGNGHTITFDLRDSDWSHVTTLGNAKLILNDATIASAGYNSGHWKRNGVAFACEVEFNNVTTCPIILESNAVLNDVVVNGPEDVYGIWLYAEGQTVEIDGLTVNCGRGIKIADEDASPLAKVYLSVKNAEFTTTAKAAILVTSTEGAEIKLDNVDISKVAADTFNPVWVDEDRSQYAGKVKVIGGSKFIEGTTVFQVSSAAELKSILTENTDAGSGDNQIVLTTDIDMSGVNWEPITVAGYTGAGVIVLNGNGKTITGLTAPLFAGGFAGNSGIVIENLTIADSKIVSSNDQGSGAFIECVDSMQSITLNNCHLINSTLTGSRTGGLVGWTAGYNNPNDGPVDLYVTITNCSVVNCDITGTSVGGIIGHSGGNEATFTTIDSCTIKDCDLISTDDGDWRVGVVIGTVNTGKQNDISNITASGNTLTQNNGAVTAPEGQSNLYGRFVPVTTGKLTIDGVEIK